MFDNDEDNDAPQFSVNKGYAEAYDRWREKEEFQKLKDKYKNEDADGNFSASETSSEDLDPEDLNPDVEKNFLTVLSALKSHDSTIYDNAKKFFYDPVESDDLKKATESDKKSPAKKAKPFYLKDYERKVIVEKEGNLSDEEELAKVGKFEDLPYIEQQKKLKESFKVDLDIEDIDDKDSFLKPREKTADEKKKEEDEYLAWLKGETDGLSKEDDASKLKTLHDYWNNPALEEGEKFLKDFILNKRYLDADSCEQGEAAKIPTYNEIIGEEAEQNLEDLDEDEKVLEKQENFEHKYNFRFEEPDEDFIRTYPRTIKDSLRRKDERNKQKRESYKERKEKEKEQTREEIKRLKNLKRKEIIEKLNKIKEIVGDDKLAIDPDELEKDFDPVDYDKKMKALFDENYYAKDEEEKPEFSNDSDAETDEEHVDNLQIDQKMAEFNFGNDEDIDGSEKPCTSFKDENVDEIHTVGKSGRKRKKSKFMDAIHRKKPLFDPNEKTFEQYFDEYYKLDYEDIIGSGDTVCRFKYRKVLPNDFGLTSDEILTAKPKELNSWVSVKKMSQYRPEQDELYDVDAYKKKAQDETKKKRILYSIYHKDDQEEGDDENAEKNKSHDCLFNASSTKQKINKAKESSSKPSTVANAVNKTGESGTKKKPRKRKNKNANSQEYDSNSHVRHTVIDNNVNCNKTKRFKFDNSKPQGTEDKSYSNKSVNFSKFTNNNARIIDQMSDERLKSYGINPKKIKNKMKYKK